MSDRAKARRREIQYLAISTMWGFIGALLPFALPWRASRTRGPRGQGDWPPFARVVKVDKLAAGGREGCHQKPPGPCPPRSLFPKTFSRSAHLHLLPELREDATPPLWRTAPRFLQGLEKSALTWVTFSLTPGATESQ